MNYLAICKRVIAALCLCASVSFAQSLNRVELSPEALVTLSGDPQSPFADQVYYASLTRTSSTLGGLTVTVAGVPAQLLLVAPDRITFQVPRPILRSAPLGDLLIDIRAEGLQWPVWGRYVTAHPSLYVSSNVQPWAYGRYRVGADVPLSIPEQPIPVSDENRPVVVSLYGTGWRFASDVYLQVSDRKILPSTCGKYPVFLGQDFCAFVVPAELANAGIVECRVVADKTPSNAVWIWF